MNYLLNKIKEYGTIILHRHTRPDLDAIGSQFGLYHILKDNFKEKKIYKVGDLNRFAIFGDVDEISDTTYENALVIVTDVAVSHLISDERYKLAKEVIVIDHHTNDCDVTDNFIQDTSYSSCCEFIVDLANQLGLTINKEAATCLAGGIITDTGRFLYNSVTANTFKVMAFLIERGADTQYIYSKINVETFEVRKMKNYFAGQIKYTNKNVAYLMNDASVYEKFNTTFNDVSRGMVSLMAGISEVPIWVNFTYDKESNKVVCEIRSRDIVVVDVAKKYGGGGHKQACGCTVENFDEALKVLNDLNNLV